MPFHKSLFRGRLVLTLLLIPGLCGLLACSSTSSPVAQKTYSYDAPSTPGVRMCINQCREAGGYCKQDCDLGYRQCIGGIQKQALADYDKYTREQFAAHQSIDLLPRDFERTAPCDAEKKSCMDSCENHYQSCYQSCGGVVTTTTSCQYLCF